MGSHSVTCHPAAVTFPPLPQPKMVLDSATSEKCIAKLSWPGWWLYPKTVYPLKMVTYLKNNRTVSWPGLKPATRKLQVGCPNHYTTRPPSGSWLYLKIVYPLKTVTYLRNKWAVSWPGIRIQHPNHYTTDQSTSYLCKMLLILNSFQNTLQFDQVNNTYSTYYSMLKEDRYNILTVNEEIPVLR